MRLGDPCPYCATPFEPKRPGIAWGCGWGLVSTALTLFDSVITGGGSSHGVPSGEYNDGRLREQKCRGCGRTLVAKY